MCAVKMEATLVGDLNWLMSCTSDVPLLTAALPANASRYLQCHIIIEVADSVPTNGQPLSQFQASPQSESDAYVC